MKATYQNQIDKFELQIQLLQKECDRAQTTQVVKTTDEDAKTNAFMDLLEDFKQLQSVLSQHDETTSEAMSTLLEEKLSSENFFIDKIRYLESKNSKLSDDVKDLEKKLQKTLQEHQTEINYAEQIRDQDIEHYKARELEWQNRIQIELEQMQGNVREESQRDVQAISELNIVLQRMNIIITNQTKPNYQQAETVIKSLQQENHALRVQTDKLNE